MLRVSGHDREIVVQRGGRYEDVHYADGCSVPFQFVEKCPPPDGNRRIDRNDAARESCGEFLIEPCLQLWATAIFDLEVVNTLANFSKRERTQIGHP